MANAYFAAEFGGIPLLIAEIDTVEGRDVVVQSPSRGDVHSLKDRGRKHRVTTCQLLFADRPGQAPYRLRFDAIRKLANDDGSAVLVHPLLGAYTAKIADFSHHATADSLSISATCTFYAEEEPEPVLTAGAGTSAEAGTEAVEIAASNANNALAEIGQASDTPNACVAAVDGWSEAEDLDSQRVFLEAASLVADLNDQIEALSVSLDQWEAYRAMCLLRYQVARAAESFTSTSTSMLEVTVGEDVPLLALMAEIYGAELAVEKRDEVQKINRLRTPGRVAKGTVLKIPAEGAA